MNTEMDWGRIRHLLKLGILAALMVLAGDMLLGWGVSNPAVTEVPTMLSRYLSVSDGRIFASALLGLIGIPMECLCWFAGEGFHLHTKSEGNLGNTTSDMAKAHDTEGLA